MNLMYRYILIFSFIIFTCVLKAQSPSVELRGVWITTVANLDWPSRAGLSESQQKQEVLDMLDYYKYMKFNTVFVQVRPSAGVFYKSKLEPWSRYLTGTQGGDPGYDPLKFWIKEAHKRGIEFQAWINPYRITNNVKDELVYNHPALKHPDWTFEYGGKMYYNPGIPEVRQFINKVVAEIVSNYNIDGIHFDDYFYPYPIAGENLPDYMTYVTYNSEGVGIKEWRRNNVNRTIKELHATIKSIKPNVKFGISPFGVWRNVRDDERGSITSASITNYDNLYADVLLWLQQDWIDYITPQIYWSTDNKIVPYNHLVEWWANNSAGKDVYIGHAIYKVDSKEGAWSDASQIPMQIKKARDTKGVKGSVYFRHHFITENRLHVTDSIRSLYRYPALIPVCIKNNKHIHLKTPYRLKYRKRKKLLTWKYKGSDIKYYALYIIRKGGSRQLVKLEDTKECVLNFLKGENNVVGIEISVVDKMNNESVHSKKLRIKRY